MPRRIFRFEAWRRRNIIGSLRHDDGRVTNDEEKMEEIVSSYFQQLFSSNGCGDTEHILARIERCVFEEENSKLIANYMEEEVLTALKEMDPMKASGEDAFSAIFFQHFWHIMRDEVTEYCLGILNKVLYCCCVDYYIWKSCDLLANALSAITSD
ncbi:hypothetical protein J1N35_036995 [Gossypium stocksii]|uniref:Reverse transcriptase n=1 Tax=Gossypium stocksii TaxID=47602 RepID=A0A9D3UJC7_9ROSI|nr:hypothetical protein J1N35_036995 [Gossypium stocksii]